MARRIPRQVGDFVQLEMKKIGGTFCLTIIIITDVNILLLKSCQKKQENEEGYMGCGLPALVV